MTFSVSSGPLGIDTTDATTDQNGQAKAGLRSTSVTATFPGYFPSAITASSQYGSVTFTATVFVTTALGGADIPASFAAFARSMTIRFENEEELIFADALVWRKPAQGSSLIEQMQSLT